MRLADPEIVEDGARDQRDFGVTGVEADAFVFEKSSDAGSGFQSKRAPAGQHHRMDALRNVAGSMT